MRPKVLFLAHLLPWPLEGGGQIKSYYFLRALSQAYDITLLAFIRREAERENVAPLEALCAGGVACVPLPRSRARDLRAAARALVTGRSFIVSRDDSAPMRAQVEREMARRPYAALHLDHLQMAQFIPGNLGGACVVLDEHNVEYRISQRMAEAGGSPLLRAYAAIEWGRVRAFEQAAIRRADRVLAVSDEDRAALAALAPEREGRIATVPIGVDTAYFGAVRRAPGARTLLSIGTMYWPPNVDAALYFCGEILPKIRCRRAPVQVCFVGARPTATVRALAADPAVVVTGSVPDVRPYAQECGVFVVPLRSGSGMRVKILNAMAMGLPVVSTTVGAEGIDVKDGVNILLADTPDAFADAVVRVLDDPALGQRLGEEGRRLMEERYSWDVVGSRLRAVYGAAAPQAEGQAA